MENARESRFLFDRRAYHRASIGPAAGNPPIALGVGQVSEGGFEVLRHSQGNAWEISGRSGRLSRRHEPTTEIPRALSCISAIMLAQPYLVPSLSCFVMLSVMS